MIKGSGKLGRFVITFLSLGLLLTGCSQKAAKRDMDVLVLIPLTGPAAEYAKYSQMGFSLAERDIIPVGGASIKVRYVDTRSDPKEAVTALNQALLVKRPDAVIALMSTILKAVGPVLEQQHIPVIANAVAAPNVARPDQGLFRVFPTADVVARTAVDLASKNNCKTIALVYVNDEYGAGTRESLAASAEKQGIQVSSAEPFAPVERDFRNQWKRILANNPDCVFVAGYGPGYSAVLQQLGEQAYQGTVVTDFTLSAPHVLKATGGVKDGTFVIGPAIRPEFRDKALAAFPNAAYFVNVATAYDALRLLGAAGADDNSVPLATRISRVNLQDGAFGSLRLAASGDEEIPMTVYKVQNGSLQIIGS